MRYLYYFNGELVEGNPQPLCRDILEHNYKFFIRNDKVSDFEEICNDCGSVRLNINGHYSMIGWGIYLGGNNFKQVLIKSEEIKKEKGLVDKFD